MSVGTRANRAVEGFCREVLPIGHFVAAEIHGCWPASLADGPVFIEARPDDCPPSMRDK